MNRADIDRVTRGVVPTTHRRRSVWLKGYQAKVDALKRLQAGTAAKLDALLSSVLDKTFRGEL